MWPGSEWVKGCKPWRVTRGLNGGSGLQSPVMASVEVSSDLKRQSDGGQDVEPSGRAF